MGTNNLSIIGTTTAVKAAGSLVDQYGTAIGTDFVPRNAAGVVTNEAGALGSPTYRWTTIDSADGADLGGNGTYLKYKLLDIGDWNMNTTETLAVAHGLTITDIREIRVYIRNDDNDEVYPLDYSGQTVLCKAGGTGDVSVPMPSGEYYVGATNVNLKRIKGIGSGGGSDVLSFFDSTDFEATSYNRGWIKIWYE